MKNKSQLQEQQVSLGLKEPPLNKVFLYKQKFEQTFYSFAIDSKWKNGWLWLFLAVSISLVVSQIFWILDARELQDVFPIFVYRQSPQHGMLADSEYLWLFPGFSVLTLIIFVIFYQKEKFKFKYIVNFLMLLVLLSISANSYILFMMIAKFL